jgi:hypothetical protein
MIDKNETRTANYLCDLALLMGERRALDGNKYVWALSMMTALFDQVRHGANAQYTIDRKCAEFERELAGE